MNYPNSKCKKLISKAHIPRIIKQLAHKLFCCENYWKGNKVIDEIIPNSKPYLVFCFSLDVQFEAICNVSQAMYKNTKLRTCTPIYTQNIGELIKVFPIQVQVYKVIKL